MEGSPVASTSKLPEETAIEETRRGTSQLLTVDNQTASTESPVIRGRGRGRPRGSKARGRGRPRGKGLPKLGWHKRPRPGDSSDDEIQFLAQHTVHPDKGSRASQPPAGGSDGAQPNSDAVPDVAAVSGKRSRSGRQIVKPVKIVPSTEPSFYRVGPRRTQSGRETAENGDATECQICSEGSFLPANLLVTCDICETSYHQLCHIPAISDNIAKDNESAWYCLQCESKRSIGAPLANWEERVSGQGLPERDKQEYLQKLPHPVLVELLLDIESHVQDARIYPPNLVAILSDYRRALAAEREQIQARQIALDSLLDEEARKLDDHAGKRTRQAGDASADIEDRTKRVRSNPPSQDMLSGLANLPDVSASANPHSDPARQPGKAVEASEDLLDPELRAISSKDTQTTSALKATVAATSSGVDGPRQATGYEEMAIEALEYINDPLGSYPRTLFQWMYDTYPVIESFRASAGQAINRAVKRGRLLKEGRLYKINPHFDDSVLSNLQKYPSRTLKLAATSTRKPSGPKPREEYLTPSAAPVRSADGTHIKNQDIAVGGSADQFDMLADEDDYLNADQLEDESFDEDHDDVGVIVPDFVIPQEPETQDADMDSFLAEFMSASNGDEASLTAPSHGIDHLLDPSLFGPDSFQSSFYLPD